MPDFILNGQATGSVASTLMANGFDPGCLRPFVGKDGRSYICTMQINNEGKLVPIVQPLANAAATLNRDEWKLIDDTVAKTARLRLQAVADLRSRGLVLNIPNGMGKTVLESYTMGHITPATISMDAVRQAEADRPETDFVNLPLPIIHKDFHFTARQIAVSRQGRMPLDTTMIELATEVVVEEAEKLLVGTLPEYTYGGGTVYGYLNFPGRITFTITDPESGGWTPDDLVNEILEMRQAATDARFRGPFVVYMSSDFDLYLDKDYSETKGDNTLRDRILNIRGIQSIETLDYLPAKTVLMVQMTAGTVREVIGMDVTTVQWETMGGLMQHFKVMAIMVPQLRSDPDGNSGIVHGAVAAPTTTTTAAPTTTTTP